MCRSLEDGGRRCDRDHRRARSAEARSREYHRARSRRTGEPDPFDELDEAVERFRAMREVSEEVLVKQRLEMIGAGLTEEDADRVTEARREAMLDGLLAVLATTEHRWTASNFTKGRGVKTRRAEAADAEQAARDRSYDSRIVAARVESEVIETYARPGESRDDTVHRLSLSAQRTLPLLHPSRLLDWDTLGHLGHERAA